MASVKCGEALQIVNTEELSVLGIVHEANRRFFHPLGLALLLLASDEKKQTLSVADFRDDPVGVTFTEEILSLDAEKIKRFGEFSIERWKSRLNELGYVIQPLPDDVTVE